MQLFGPVQVFSESLRKDEKIGSRRENKVQEPVVTSERLSRLRDARRQRPSGRFPGRPWITTCGRNRRETIELQTTDKLLNCSVRTADACLLTASLHEPSLRPRPEQEATGWPLQNVEDYDQEWISGDSNGDSKGTPRGDLCVGYFMLSESACTGRVGRSNAGVGTGDIRGE